VKDLAILSSSGCEKLMEYFLSENFTLFLYFLSRNNDPKNPVSNKLICSCSFVSELYAFLVLETW
jgi:hypothetical protein